MVAVKHKFNSAKTDGTDTTLIQPSSWNDSHDVTMSASGKVLGRTSAGAGPVEELDIATIGGVQSVAGKTGVVTLAKADITDAGTAIGYDIVQSASPPSGTPTKPTLWIVT